MRAAKRTGADMYFKYTGSLEGQNMAASKDKILDGESASKGYKNKAGVNNRVWSNTNSYKQEYGTNTGIKSGRYARGSVGKNVEGSASLDGQLTYDSTKVTIDSANDGPANLRALRGSDSRNNDPNVSITNKESNGGLEVD